MQITPFLNEGTKVHSKSMRETPLTEHLIRAQHRAQCFPDTLQIIIPTSQMRKRKVKSGRMYGSAQEYRGFKKIIWVWEWTKHWKLEQSVQPGLRLTCLLELLLAVGLHLGSETFQETMPQGNLSRQGCKIVNKLLRGQPSLEFRSNRNFFQMPP